MDPAMADSNDKLASTAGFARLMKAHDKMAALEEMGYGDFIRKQGLESLRFPELGEYESAMKNGPSAVSALYEACGLDGICEDQWVSVESVRDKATGLVKSISKNFRFLAKVLDRHEATIQWRWVKKTNRSRLNIIIEAWGAKMAVPHRPNFEAIELEDEAARFIRTGYRDSYLWPYINEEDLCKPHSPLLLMSTRSRCHPSVLAATEHEAHSVGERLLVFGYTSPGLYLMDLINDGDEDCYGKLWSQHSDPDAYASLQLRSYMSPHSGLLVLEAQERVSSFLVNCANTLLHDFTEDSMLVCPPSPFIPTLTTKTNTGYASWAAIASEAPYRKPASLDFDRIASLLAGKHDEVADHQILATSRRT
jgi:hypothetical protein